MYRRGYLLYPCKNESKSEKKNFPSRSVVKHSKRKRGEWKNAINSLLCSLCLQMQVLSTENRAWISSYGWQLGTLSFIKKIFNINSYVFRNRNRGWLHDKYTVKETCQCKNNIKKLYKKKITILKFDHVETAVNLKGPLKVLITKRYTGYKIHNYIQFIRRQARVKYKICSSLLSPLGEHGIWFSGLKLQVCSCRITHAVYVALMSPSEVHLLRVDNLIVLPVSGLWRSVVHF